MKQEKFVLGVVEGKSQRQSYIDAGYSTNNLSENKIDSKASDLLRTGKIWGRYKELLKEFQSKSLWTREEALEDYRWLKEMARDEIKVEGVKHALATAYLGSLEGMNKLVFEDDHRNKKIEAEIKMLYKKIELMDKTGESTQESEVASMLRGLAGAIDESVD